jgi:transmembrane sensor
MKRRTAMSKVVRFPDTRKTLEEASLWLVSLEEGLADDERRALEEWLAADPRHGKALVQLANVWGAFDALAELAETFPLHQYRPRRHRAFVLKVAAAAAVVIAVGALGWHLTSAVMRPSSQSPISVELPEPGSTLPQTAAARGGASRSYETAVGEQLSARLPDGSVVTLNTNTLLRVDYSAAVRLVTIERGEASFNVQQDTTRPFRVLARNAVVEALGTIFSVQLAVGERIEVTVSGGRVRVTAAPKDSAGGSSVAPTPIERGIDVQAGQLAVINDPGEVVRSIDPLEIEAKLAWQRGLLIFRGEPLEAVVADVSRYTTVKFTLADESIRSTRVGGYFRTGDVEALLIALRESFGIEAQRIGDEIILTAQK